MKKVLLFLLTASLACMALAGCGAGAPPAQSAAFATAESQPPKPIHGDRIQDGTYPIEVSSNSSMFKIVDALLTVADGEMSAVITLGGDGYEKLYMGTGEQALADNGDSCVYFVQNADGQYTYALPVAALDEETDVAAWSIRKQTWYDRVLVFESSRIPKEAIAAE